MPSIRVRQLVLVAVLVGLGQADAWARFGSGPYHGSRGLSAALALVAAGAVAWSSRWPLAALGTAVAAVAGSRLVVAHDASFAEGFLPLIVLTASVGFYSPRRTALAGLALSELALLVVVLEERRLRSVASFVVDSLFLVVPWAAAVGLRRRAELAETLTVDLRRVKAEQAEREAAVLAEERARIARELHDIVAHTVSVMVVNAGAARLRLGDGDATVRDQLLVVERTGRQALAELRRLLGVLRTDSAQDDAGPDPTPRLDQLDGLLGGFRAGGLDVSLEQEGARAPLPLGLEVSAFRIVQEALTNVVKHAGPTAAATVRVVYGSHELELEVLDRGGRAIPLDLPSTGHGLVGARERAALFGGTAEAGPLPGGGWRLTARLPLPAETTEAAR